MRPDHNTLGYSVVIKTVKSVGVGLLDILDNFNARKGSSTAIWGKLSGRIQVCNQPWIVVLSQNIAYLNFSLNVRSQLGSSKEHDGYKRARPLKDLQMDGSREVETHFCETPRPYSIQLLS